MIFQIMPVPGSCVDRLPGCFICGYSYPVVDHGLCGDGDEQKIKPFNHKGFCWIAEESEIQKPGHDGSKKGFNAGKEMNFNGAVEVPEGLALCE
jgi:hypothetical protein